MSVPTPRRAESLYDPHDSVWDTVEEFWRSRPAWMSDPRRNCHGVPNEVFFGSDDAVAVVCKGCLFERECLEYALENNEDFGVWGGKSERGRRALQRKRLQRSA